MQKRLLCLVLFLLLAAEGFSQELFISRQFESSFFSEARLENIAAVSGKGVSVINISSREVAFKIPIRSFKFKNGLMQEHFNETYLESDKYPNATFTGKLMEGVDLTQDGTYNVIVSGNLAIHGVVKARTIAGVLTIEGTRIVLNTTFMVPVNDHAIDIPNDKLTNISQNIQVKVKALYEPKS